MDGVSFQNGMQCYYIYLLLPSKGFRARLCALEYCVGICSRTRSPDRNIAFINEQNARWLFRWVEFAQLSGAES